jgi:hypothetical protein
MMVGLKEARRWPTRQYYQAFLHFQVQADRGDYWLDTCGFETGPAVPKPRNPNIVYSNCKGRFGIYNKLTGREMQFYVGTDTIYDHNPKNLNFRFQRVVPFSFLLTILM